MALEIQTVLSQNVTLVYDVLELRSIDRNALRSLSSDQPQPMVMDTPEMIVVVYPSGPTIVQVGDRRCRITYQRKSEGVGDYPLWEIASKCHQLVETDSSSRIIAFGFNYDVGGMADENTNILVQRILTSDKQAKKMEEALEGEILSIIPRVKFKRNSVLYDLLFEPSEEEKIKIHLNAHFSSDDAILPSPDKLEDSFRNEYEQFTSILFRLF